MSAYELLIECIEKEQYYRYIEFLARIAGEYVRCSIRTGNPLDNGIFEKLKALRIDDLGQRLTQCTGSWEDVVKIDKALRVTFAIALYECICNPHTEDASERLRILMSSPYYTAGCAVKSIPQATAYIMTSKFDIPVENSDSLNIGNRNDDSN